MIETAIEPNGCRHCGVGRRVHLNRYIEGVGWHGWVEPTNAQRLARMYARRAPSCRCRTWAGDIREPRPNGHHPLCDGTGQQRPVVLNHLHDIDAGGNCRAPICAYNSDDAYEQAVSAYVRGDGPNPYGEVSEPPTDDHVLLQIGTRDAEGRRTFAVPGDVCTVCSDPATGHWVPVSQCSAALADADRHYAGVLAEALDGNPIVMSNPIGICNVAGVRVFNSAGDPCTDPHHAHTLNAALDADASPDEDPVTWRHCADCHGDNYDHGTDRTGPHCGHIAGCPNC